MNETGVLLLWCVLQATLNLLVGAGVYLVARRFGPATGAVAVASTLVMLCCVTVAAFSPWPRWSLSASGRRDAVNDTSQTNEKATAEVTDDDSAGSKTGDAPARPKPAGTITLKDYWQVFRAELEAARSQASSADAPRRWPIIVAALFIAGASLAMTRYVIGILALRRYRRRLLPIADRRLSELAESMAEQFGCRSHVELRQSQTLTTPATMGWRRPAIVLPSDWPTWTDAERRVVLAHEMAHIARGDYVTWLLAQVAVALHVYHPLVHWLAGRLRLEQELAADAWAAEASGGRETYLFTLAQMALRQDDRRVAWAARPFLPSRGTLLRRIEMLSETKRLQNVPVSRRRALALASVAGLVAVLVSGVRAPLGDAPLAQAAPPEKPRATATAAERAIDLSYVPPSAVAVLALRPADLLAKADMQPLVKLLNDTAQLKQRLTGLQIEKLEQVTLAVTRLPESGQPANPDHFMLRIFRYQEPFDWKGKFGESLVGKHGEATVAGKTYYHSDRSDAAVRPAFYLPDDRTIVVGPEIDLQRMIITGEKRRPEWAAEWQKSATGQAAAMVDLAAVGRAINEESKRHPLDPIAMIFAPIWEKGQRLFVSLQAQQGLAIAAQIQCASNDDAGRVRDTLQAVLTLARNMLDEADRNVAKASATQAAAMVPLIDLAGEALKQGKLKTGDSAVSYATTLDLDVAETAVSVVAPAVVAAREAAQRAQAFNNLKQLMLAFYNYHDVYGHFPAPAVLGPDGKTRHSWRVAILPFVEQATLYNQYKLDEPWDSENNKKVLAQMPSVYRDPGADPTGRDACYFALIGPTTVLGSLEGKGTTITEITDGTSNTIALVEAKRSVPWTKPEDIDYDPEKPLPKLGGWRRDGFCAGFADGHVSFLPDTIKQHTIRALITKAGGELIANP